jgi:hypothetical protein
MVRYATAFSWEADEYRAQIAAERIVEHWSERASSS